MLGVGILKRSLYRSKSRVRIIGRRIADNRSTRLFPLIMRVGML